MKINKLQQQCSISYGHTPKFIFIRIGNSPTSKIVPIMRGNCNITKRFAESQQESILVLM